MIFNRHVDMAWPLWNILDYTPEGRGEHWYPKVKYDWVNKYIYNINIVFNNFVNFNKIKNIHNIIIINILVNTSNFIIFYYKNIIIILHRKFWIHLHEVNQ